MLSGWLGLVGLGCSAVPGCLACWAVSGCFFFHAACVLFQEEKVIPLERMTTFILKIPQGKIGWTSSPLECLSDVVAKFLANATCYYT